MLLAAAATLGKRSPMTFGSFGLSTRGKNGSKLHQEIRLENHVMAIPRDRVLLV